MCEHKDILDKFPEIVNNIPLQQRQEIYDKYIRPADDLSFNHNSSDISLELRNLSRDFVMQRDRLMGGLAQNTQGFITKRLVEALSMVQTVKANEVYYRRYDDASYLYRATTTGELDQMLKGVAAWQNWKGGFDYSSITVSRQAALEYVRSNKRHQPDEIGVILEFPKSEISRYVVSPGYDLTLDEDAKGIDDPMIENIENEEHRLKKTIAIDKVHIRAIIFTDSDHDFYKQRYNILSNVDIRFEGLI